ncbi:cell wall hydrolase [Sphingomonas sp. 3-13AW]|uniref:cell wall hydrolase n=1 Tax=Sphingomonas sp. 3-13AW TaxID=3050450 RepID=UPI003BB727AE
MRRGGIINGRSEKNLISAVPTGRSWVYLVPIAAGILTVSVSDRFIPANPVNARRDIMLIPPPSPASVPSPAPAATVPSRQERSRRSLREAVKKHPIPDRRSRELDCLARTIYFEARGEPLEGQLAVAHTVLNRTRSDSFPDSICAVVRQPSQFSFVRGREIPEVDATSKAWRTAIAVALLAKKGWPSRARKALYFHATYVSPGWNRQAVARIGAHHFYS